MGGGLAAYWTLLQQRKRRAQRLAKKGKRK
jgi:hypothetical protein